MLNPALVEMVARDRIAERQRAGAKRSFGPGSSVAADTTTPQTPLFSIRHARPADLQHAMGWLLRLALPRTRAGSGR